MAQSTAASAARREKPAPAEIVAPGPQFPPPGVLSALMNPPAPPEWDSSTAVYWTVGLTPEGVGGNSTYASKSLPAVLKAAARLSARFGCAVVFHRTPGFQGRGWGTGPSWVFYQGAAFEVNLCDATHALELLAAARA